MDWGRPPTGTAANTIPISPQPNRRIAPGSVRIVRRLVERSRGRIGLALAALVVLLGIAPGASPAQAAGASASAAAARIGVPFHAQGGAPTYGLSGTRAAEDADGVGAWQLADAIADELDGTWRPKLGAYDGQTGIAIRTNAMLLELFARAAREGHTGPARNDERAARLVELLTQPPVLVWKTNLKRASAIFPHAPAFAAAYLSDPTRAPLHPSADAIVARALAEAWKSRGQLGLDPAHQVLIKRAVGAVAGGSFYRKGRRADNQINWNADVLMADAEVNGSKNAVMAYRHQLIWFARYMRQPSEKGGAPNTSAGGAFYYWPPAPTGAGINRTGTVEYANLVRSALGWYGEARADGMPPIPAWALARLRRWSNQVVMGTWTEAGYLNWDTGLAAKRRHLRQYWAFALDALVRGSRAGAIGGNPTDRGFARAVAARGVELFARTAWDGTGPLPGPTSFGAPNGFPSATNNDATTPLRFAIIELSRRELLSDVSPLRPKLVASQDQTAGRLAITTDAYNTAIIRSGPSEEGGLEPTRLYDGKQRPLTVLMGDAFAGPTPGVRLLKGKSRVLADTQPGHDHGLPTTSAMGVPAQRVNRTARYSAYAAVGRTADQGTRITVTHHFSTTRIRTSYALHPGQATRFVIRFPFWGADADVKVLGGATADLARTTGALRFGVTTAAGARYTVSFGGIPSSHVDLRLTTTAPTGRAPDGTRSLQVVGSAKGLRSLTRTITISPSQ